MRIILLILLGSGLALLAADTNQVREVTIKAPSDLRAKGALGSTPYTLDFVLRPIDDFRLMYCDPKTLKARISAGPPARLRLAREPLH
jgi:hypothetical protein